MTHYARRGLRTAVLALVIFFGLIAHELIAIPGEGHEILNDLAVVERVAASIRPDLH